MEKINVIMSKNNRICPMPQKWNELWNMLPDKEREGNGWNPSLPLILAAWHETSNQQKKERFESHIRWAVEHNFLDSVTEFLCKLDEGEWFHEND